MTLPGRSAKSLETGFSRDVLDHSFAQPRLLRLALTHRSLSYETNPSGQLDPAEDNEQLEFVGDAVLGFVIAESLYRRFPSSREGELTRLRASIVSRKHLGEVATRLRLGDWLLLGRGEEQSGGRKKTALLANALEAVIAALYLDGGIEPAKRFIEKHVLEPALPELESALQNGGTFSGAVGDHKSALQEHLQSLGLGQPHYVLKAQIGPDHQKSFHVEVQVDDGHGRMLAIAESIGSTKKQAQQEAARLALLHLREKPLAKRGTSQSVEKQ